MRLAGAQILLDPLLPVDFDDDAAVPAGPAIRIEQRTRPRERSQHASPPGRTAR